MDAVGKDQLCRQGLHIFLQIPLQRSGPVNRIVAIVHDELLCLIGQGDGQLLIGQTPVDVCRQKVHDPSDVVLCQRLKEDGLIQTV